MSAGRRLAAAVVSLALALTLGALPGSPLQREAVAAPAGTVSFDYDQPGVRIAGIKGENRLRGHVVAPAAGRKKRGLVLFLHGFHTVCTNSRKQEVTGWPCPRGSIEVPNHRGFEYAQQALAKQGFVTISIDANNVTAQDQDLLDKGAAARAQLVRAHLQRLAAWQSGRMRSPWPKRAARYDLQQVMLVGRSRGGEGVVRATVDSRPRDPWRVRAVVPVASTAFMRLGAPTVPTLTILPSCDGDVLDLAGQIYTDAAVRYGRGAALHSTVLVNGGVHNLFNTQWTPGMSVGPTLDDGNFAQCPKAKRLSASQHQQVLSTWLTQSAKAFLSGDVKARSVVQGSTKPAGPVARWSQVTPLGGGRRLLFNASGATSVRQIGASPTGRAHWCGAKTCRSDPARETAPHWLVGDSRDGFALSMTLAKGQHGGVRLSKPVTVRAGDVVELRVVARGKTPAQLMVRPTGSSGKPVVLRGAKPVVLQRLGLGNSSQGSGERDLAQLVRFRIPSGTRAFALTGLDLQALSASNVAVLDASVVHRIPRPRGRIARAVIDAPRTVAVKARTGRLPSQVTVTLPVTGRVQRLSMVAVSITDMAATSHGEEVSIVRWAIIRPGQKQVRVTLPIQKQADDGSAAVHIAFQIETRGPVVVRNPVGTIRILVPGR